jgi:hypothetical protein
MWFQLNQKELEIVRDALSYSIANNRAGALQLQEKFYEGPDPCDELFRSAVLTSDELEVDPDAVVSRGEDGAFVMSWTWVSNEDAGIKDACCENCGSTDNDGSDVCSDCGGAIIS